MRDMTDTMYNPQMPPGVDHFTGTDLVEAEKSEKISIHSNFYDWRGGKLQP
ncbi:MAG: hypothetical protein ACJA1W_004706, partial [Akkermansiaceae bacterium]